MRIWFDSGRDLQLPSAAVRGSNGQPRRMPRPDQERHDTERQRADAERDHLRAPSSRRRRSTRPARPARAADTATSGTAAACPAASARSSMRPTICPMNCTRIRVVISASITVPSENSAARRSRARRARAARRAGSCFGRMQPAEHAEEVAVARRGVRDARVAEQQREHRAERRPQHQQREDRRDASSRRAAP